MSAGTPKTNRVSFLLVEWGAAVQNRVKRNADTAGHTRQRRAVDALPLTRGTQRPPRPRPADPRTRDLLSRGGPTPHGSGRFCAASRRAEHVAVASRGSGNFSSTDRNALLHSTCTTGSTAAGRGSSGLSGAARASAGPRRSAPGLDPCGPAPRKVGAVMSVETVSGRHVAVACAYGRSVLLAGPTCWWLAETETETEGVGSYSILGHGLCLGLPASASESRERHTAHAHRS
jgi:hypothetical protein